jgi:signal transduction histidine kinase
MDAQLARLRARVAELEREHEQLEQEKARLERFAATAAHEVLKPLVMTEAYAEMLLERMGHSLELDSRRDLDAMVRISSRVRLLVATMLADARDAHGQLERENVDVAELLRDCVRMLDREIKMRDAHLEIEPMPVVQADPALLSGVFSNLISNALKYGPRSGADIRVSVERSEAGWTFGVDSPGPAVPEHARDEIFEAWRRGPGERRAAGVGLGLAIVRQIVERHGGQVGVTSPNDRSNRFYFTLPA